MITMWILAESER